MSKGLKVCIARNENQGMISYSVFGNDNVEYEEYFPTERTCVEQWRGKSHICTFSEDEFERLFPNVTIYSGELTECVLSLVSVEDEDNCEEDD